MNNAIYTFQPLTQQTKNTQKNY